jgi:hypothetical protein
VEEPGTAAPTSTADAALAVADRSMAAAEAGGQAPEQSTPPAPSASPAAPEQGPAPAAGQEGTTLDQLPQEVRDAVAFHQRLNDPATQREALNELLDRFDLELPDDDDDDDLDDEDVDATATDQQEVSPEMQYLLERERAREAAEQQQAQQQAVETARQHVQNQLSEYAKSIGHEDGKLPDADRQNVLARALALPANADGLPNIEQAIKDHDAYVKAVLSQFVEKKSSAPPAPNLQGNAGTQKPNLADEKERLAAANAVAARHLGGT